MAGRRAFKEERERHLEAIGQKPLPLPSERRQRPISFTDDLPDEAADLGASGLSDTEIAAHWAIDMQTLNAWREAHPALDEAMSRARTAAEAWWEEKARRALELRDNRFPAGAWAMVMKARFPNYRERVEISGSIDVTRRLVILDLRAGPLSEQSLEGAKPLIEHGPARLVASQTGESGTQLDLSTSPTDQADGCSEGGSGQDE